MQLYVHKNRYWCRHFWSSHLVYTLRMVALFDDTESAIIDENDWWGRELYLSQDRLERLEAHDEIAQEDVPFHTPEQLLNSMQWTNALISVTGRALWKQTRLALKGREIQRAYDITVGDLTRGVDLEGELDEIVATERLLVTSATALAAKLDDAAAFHGGTRIVPIGRQPALPAPKAPRRIA